MESAKPSLGDLAIAQRQLEFARNYTLTLLADIQDDEWFRVPAGLPTHLAWQIGHLAMAEYGLTLLRLRGKLPSDASLIDNDFMRTFKKGSLPSPSIADYPPLPVIRETFERVHREALMALPTYDVELLGQGVEMPYVGHPNKLGSILFCSAHEMLHAGQIGILRRALGKMPVR